MTVAVRSAAAVGPRGRRDYPAAADEDLILLVAERDERAFAALYDRHGRSAFALARRMTGERQAAEDLTQEAFVAVWRSAGTYRPRKGSVRTWILSVVHNRGIDYLRSRASRRRVYEKVQAESARQEPGDAFEETWRGALREKVGRALGALPPEQGEVLALSYYSGYTHVEISRMLDLPLGTVKGRIRQGLKKAARHLSAADVT